MSHPSNANLSPNGERRSSIRFDHDSGNPDQVFYAASVSETATPSIAQHDDEEDQSDGESLANQPRRYQLQDSPVSSSTSPTFIPGRSTFGRASFGGNSNTRISGGGLNRTPVTSSYFQNNLRRQSAPLATPPPPQQSPIGATYGTNPFDIISPTSSIAPPPPSVTRGPRGSPPGYRSWASTHHNSPTDSFTSTPPSLPRNTSSSNPFTSSPEPTTTRPPFQGQALDLNGQPVKPSLRRSSTEEHLRHLAARQAIDLVNSHSRATTTNSNARNPSSINRTQRLRRSFLEDTPKCEDEELGLPSRSNRRDEEEEGMEYEHERVAAGVLSHLLKLYGNQQQQQQAWGRGASSGGLRRSSSCHTSSSWDGVNTNDKSPEEFFDAQGRPVKVPRLRRTRSDISLATTYGEDELIDPEDPRFRHRKESFGTELGRTLSYSDDEGVKEDMKSVGKKRKSRAARREGEVLEAMKGDRKSVKRKDKELQITANVADILQRQNFILKLAKALMTFGAPSHRLESQLNATAKVLDVDAQFVHIPSVVIASFGDVDTHTSETKFVKASGGLNLGMLHDVHGIYRSVVHDEIGVEEGNIALTRMLRAEPIYNLWQRMLIASMCAGIIAPLGFGGSFVDAFVSGAFGATLAFLQLYAAKKNAIFSNIFEISIAALISFISRGLSTTNYFCYEALSSAGVVLVLPGYIILCGSLELASKNLIAGSVRMVYAIIYTLFLGFSIAVGSDLFFLFDPSARHAQATVATASSIVMDGTFIAANTSNSFTGSFSFTNSSSTVNTAQASLQKGNIMCYRDPSWEWWRQGASVYWLILLVPAFSFFLSLWNLQPIKSRELPVMVLIAIIGFITNRLATEYIFDRSDIVSFIGATVIGLLGNLYSRVFKGTSFTAMATGVLFLVPSGIAAAGGLAMTQTGDGNSYNSGLMIGFRMVQVAIGITIGLFFASFCVYSVGTKKSSGSLGFAF